MSTTSSASETEKFKFGQCRCCLKMGYHKDLTKPYSRGCVREVYRKLLMQCFNLFLSTSPKLTNLICVSCIKQLHEALEFKTMVTESEKQLLGEVGSSDTVSGNEPEIGLHSELEMKFEHNVTVKEEPLDFEHEVAVKQEPEDCSEDYNDAVDDSGRYLTIEFEIEQNETSGHQIAPNVDSPSSFEGTTNYIPIKGEILDIEHDVKKVKKKSVKRHLQNHSSERNHMCDLCSYAATTESHLKRHIKRNHTGEKAYACDICNKKFYYKSNFIIHTRVHTGEKPYACDLCDQKFAQSCHLKYHVKIHTSEKAYACEICDKRFSNVSNLNEHNKVHTGEKPFACELCDKKFTRNNTLARHVRVHTDVKPYVCKVCDKKFTQNSYLIQHSKIHTGTKPYSCDLCGKNFSRKGHLSDHISSHTDKKPYGCPVCGLKFKVQGTLSKHIKRNTCKPNTSETSK